ncbi:type IV minor pilin protein FimT [Shewanella sairae]|uniref:Type II secretion system protein H n=1 Tax=Shewanella sairae TaxID=190310 RepID=A0ABQ4PE93_9GAMM|nr:GspH/FimT family pseudopilin [Shewanella sairae]MCL1128660.1 GspH/FimT family pseudopilin [Shewanella sairae]GIU45858.1 type IV minor pilin protein FimT [Shewanella sairae]
MLKKSAGFTVTELMVAMVVVTILISIATLSLKSIYAHVRSDSNIRTIQQSIQLARNYAIAYGLRVTVCPLQAQICTNNWQQKITVFTDSSTSNTLDGVDQVIHTLGPFSKNDFVTYNRAAIRFQPEGLASGTNGTLRYCPDAFDNKYSRSIIVSQSGRVRLSTKPVICAKS